MLNTYCSNYRFEGNIDAEVQQRAVEYFALSQKGPSMVDIMAEMPKFPERQVVNLKFLSKISLSLSLSLSLSRPKPKPIRT